MVLLLVSCSKSEPTSHSSLSDEISNQKYVNIIENRLSNLPVDAQVAIAIVKENTTEYLGVINKNGTLRSTQNANNIFEIGSITKLFTSICLSDLIAKNEASLTETLQEQFNFPIQAGGDITLKQLANHTSGLPRLPSNVNEVIGFNQNDPYAVYTYENLKSFLENHVVLNSPSGTKYEYSNIGTGMLGSILAKKRNMSYEELVKITILDPLNMTSTTTLLDNVDTSLLIEPRDNNGVVSQYWSFSEYLTAAGSLKSTVTDMAKFIRKNFENDPLYNLPQQKTFQKEDNEFIGLGWLITEDEDYRVLSHDGNTGGFASILVLDKNKKTGVIVLSNIEAYHPSIVPMCNDLFLEASK